MGYPVQGEIFRQTFLRAQGLYQAGRLREAAGAFKRVLALDPNAAPALHALGRIALQSGNAKGAVQYFSRARKLDPDQPLILNDLAVALIKTGDIARAGDMFRRLIKLQPDNPDGYRNLGLFLTTHHQYDEAISVLETYVSMAPEDGDGHALLATACYYAHRHSRADAENTLALRMQPQAAGPHELAGLLHLAEGRVAEAISDFDAALARDPKRPSTLGNKGQALASVGRFAEARAALKMALELDPLSLPFLLVLTDLGPVLPEDDRLPYLKRAEEKMAALDKAGRAELNFTLGKVADDLGAPEKAMAYWQAAAELRRELMPYDEGRELGQLKAMARVFTPELLAARKGLGKASSQPVFIVGMPRSGTSLTEQILASHPDVCGIGEGMAWNAMVDEEVLGADFPAHVPALASDVWEKAGARYLGYLKKQGGMAKRVIDKQPSNFRWLGAMHLALPGAKFIWIRRRPADCALSCFSKNFRIGFAYTSDLGALGRYMRACETLMAHWKAVLPPESLLEIRYEDLVQNFDAVTHDLFCFIGLKWDPACRDFYHTDRQVVTASQYAVRQPLNMKSIGRAEAYREMLAPFFAAYGAGEREMSPS